MQLKISKTLEGLIARSAFNTTKAGITHSLKDFLALELLREEGSLAFQLLSARLRDWELHQVRLRIEHEIHPSSARRAGMPPTHSTAGLPRSCAPPPTPCGASPRGTPCSRLRVTA